MWHKYTLTYTIEKQTNKQKQTKTATDGIQKTEMTMKTKRDQQKTEAESTKNWCKKKSEARKQKKKSSNNNDDEYNGLGSFPLENLAK